MFPLGHLASPEAEAARIRDRHLLGLIGESTFGIDAEIDLREWTGPVTSQVGNSCCWDSSLGQIEAKARQMRMPIPKLSVKQAWTNAQWRDQARRGVPFAQRRAWDQGSYLDAGFLAMHEHGIASDARCPFEPGDFDPKPDGRANLQIPIDVDMASADVVFTGEYGVEPEEAPEALRSAMRRFEFPVIAIDVTERFMAISGSIAEWDGVHDGEKIIGGHAIRVVGARPRVGSSPAALLIQNSWGMGWGNEGYVWIYDAAIRRGRDAVVATAAPRMAA